jgi:hypothetical protein
MVLKNPFSTWGNSGIVSPRRQRESALQELEARKAIEQHVGDLDIRF